MGRRTGEALSNLGETILGAASSMLNRAEEKKSSITKYLVGAQIPQEVDRIYQAALKNPDAKAGLEVFQSDFIGLAKGIMSSVPEGESQIYAGRLLAHSAQQATGHLETQLQSQNENIAKYHIAQAIDKYQDMANQAALDGDTNSALAHQATIAKIMFDGVKKGFITPPSAHTLQKQIKESISKNHYLGHGIRLAEAGDAKGLEAGARDVLNDKGLSHASKTSLLSSLTSMQNANQLRLGLRAESAIELKKEMVFQAETNGKSPTAEQVIFMQSLKPKQAMDIKHAVTDGLETYNALQKQRAMPLSKKAEYLGELDEQITRSKTARERGIYTKAKEAVKEEINTLINDPIAYITKLGDMSGIEQELKNHQNNPAFQQLDSVGKEESLKQRKATLMLQLQKQLGVEPRLLSNEKAQAIVSDLQASGLVNAIPHLQKELDKYGGYASIVIKDLERAKLPVGLKYTLNASPEYAPTMIKAFGSDLKDLKAAAKIGDGGSNKEAEIKTAIREEIKDYTNTLPHTKDRVHEEAELEQAMYMAVLQELSEGKKLSKAVSNAADGIYEHKYEIDDGIRVPKFVFINERNDGNSKIKINISDVKTAKEKFNLQHFFSFQNTNDIYFDGWEEHNKKSEKYNKQLVYDGRWVTSSDDSGIFYITSSGKPVYRKNGTPYVIKFLDIAKEAREAKRSKTQ
ncbi:hypothetical protein GAMM_200015 [Gammaproteobacteria bacterium]